MKVDEMVSDNLSVSKSFTTACYHHQRPQTDPHLLLPPPLPHPPRGDLASNAITCLL